MTAPIARLTAGSSHCHPVIRIANAAITTPNDTAASPTMCRNAPFTFRSRFRPDMNKQRGTPC